MAKPNVLNAFSDILGPRRNEISNFLWVSRKLDTVLAYKQNQKQVPAVHKKEVASSQRMQELIKQISQATGVPSVDVEHEVKLILDEIGFGKQLKLIRWLGLVLTKICQKVYAGIHVNEASVHRLKTAMGNCPVIFAPSHRSYADFILMSYILFHYNIEIPSIASGMDFHAMWGMGTVLRNTGAFFMRRSFNDDRLYWATFRQYVHQLVTRGDLPIEFFIEGTRSRSCKALPPKYGLLSMILKPLFTSEVPDVLIVPINISYDRVLEEKLFAFELLGVPKPKESTSGFLKSLSIIKENYGNIYVDFTAPISVKQYLSKSNLKLDSHSLNPLHLQTLDAEERQFIADMAHRVVHTQQKHAVLTVFNLIAILVNNNMILGGAPFILDQLSLEILWLRDILEHLGARIEIYDDDALRQALLVHNNLITVKNTKVQLVQSPVILNDIDRKKTKGYQLNNNTMTTVVPMVMLQLYVNPTLHYFVDCSLVAMVIVAYRQLNKDQLFGHFRFLRSVFSYEFVLYEQRELMEFEDTLNKLQQLKVIELTKDEKIVLGCNEKLQILLTNLFNPFISAYCCVCNVLQNVSTIEQNTLLIEAQRKLERDISQMNSSVHPYCLSLDTLGTCIQQFVSLAVLEKLTEKNTTKFQVAKEKLNIINEKLIYFSTKYFGNMAQRATILPAKL
ncbi:Glyceronephosphate O-acyltransferase [Carabus blaptoides fortunei]